MLLLQQQQRLILRSSSSSSSTSIRTIARLRFTALRTLKTQATAHPSPETLPISSVRNISIIAHIDAGKTTLTERILHLTSGARASAASRPGSVDDGSTVTDFLDAERARGITIQSAAVGPVFWSSPAYAITLVDTPGHVDFGVEVERALRVVDGAVIVLDAVEGVEAQTEMVVSQAARYGLKPMLAFVNKMDRQGASLANSVRSILHSGLHRRPLVLQLPDMDADAESVLDVVQRKRLTFTGMAGEQMHSHDLKHHHLDAEVERARAALVETLAGLDDQVLDALLSAGDHAHVPSHAIHAAITRQVHAGTVLPVLCGAAARNVGVQPLLDAIGAYLPPPTPTPASASKKDNATTTPSALAFKVVHDPRRGPLTFVRVYSGTITRSTTLFNTSSNTKERCTRIMLPYAADYVETPSLRAGQIGVLLGLRDTKTGDTLSVPTRPDVHLARVHIPSPVFSMAIEPHSKADEAPLLEALAMLVRTDPSLRVDEGAGQLLLSGLGALHLEIARDRLANEFAVRAHMGKVRVRFRETALAAAEVEDVWEREMAGRKVRAGLRLRLTPLEPSDAENHVSVDLARAPEPGPGLGATLRAAAGAAFSRGPLASSPIVGIRVDLDRHSGDEDAQAVTHAVSSALRAAMRNNAALMEPVMRVRIALPPSALGKVVSDLTANQDAEVLAVDHDHDHAADAEHHTDTQIYIPDQDTTTTTTTSSGGGGGGGRTKTILTAAVPLAKLVTYSTRLRALTAGAGTFDMQLDGFHKVSEARQAEILRELGRL